MQKSLMTSAPPYLFFWYPNSSSTFKKDLTLKISSTFQIMGKSAKSALEKSTSLFNLSQNFGPN